MKRISASVSVRGFGAIDVLVVVGTVLLLLSWAYYGWLPTGGCKVRSSRIGCVSNLKQVGLAFRMYANDHNEQFPWQISVANGGTLEYVGSTEVFRHFQAISNEMTSPKPLACPNDPKRQKATSFETNFSNMNVSYFVGLDADELEPNSILSGDRNVATNGVALKGPLALLRTNSQVGWTKEIHQRQGNIALADGSANQYTPDQFRRQLTLASNSVVRLAIP